MGLLDPYRANLIWLTDHKKTNKEDKYADY